MYSLIQICSLWILFAHTLDYMYQNIIARQMQCSQFVLYTSNQKGRRLLASHIQHGCELISLSEPNNLDSSIVAERN